MANNCKKCFNAHYQPHCHPTTNSLWLCSSVHCGPPHQSRRIWLSAEADNQKHHRSTSLAFVWGIHRWPVNSPHRGPVTWKMFPFDDIIMLISQWLAHCVSTAGVNAVNAPPRPRQRDEVHNKFFKSLHKVCRPNMAPGPGMHQLPRW